MKNLINLTLGLVLVFTLATGVLAPTIALAQTTVNTASDGGVASDDPSKGASFQLVPCNGASKDAQGNPTVECDFNQLLNMINRVIKFLLYLSIPLILGIIIYTAFKFLTANGDPGKLADAKKMLIPVAIGLFWVLAAYIVVYTVLDKLLADGTSSDARSIFNKYFKN